MKKIVVLMSVSLLTLGSYSFGVAMLSEYGLPTDDGMLYGREETRQLPLEQVYKNKFNRQNTLGKIVALGNQKEQAEVDALTKDMKRLVLPGVARKKLHEDIEVRGAQSRGGEVLSDDLRILEERRSACQEKLIEKLYEIAQDQRAEFKDELACAASEFNVHALRSALKKTLSRSGSTFTQEELDALRLYSTNNGLLESGLSNVELTHVETVEKSADLKAAFDQGATEKREFLHNLQQDVASYRAALFGLAFTKVTSIDKAFKFTDWQNQLAQEYFKGPDAIEAGKIHAFRTGDILALIAYADYLDRYYKSNYTFTGAEWNELLKTILMLYVRIAQDCHTVAAVNAFVDAMISGNFPVDARLDAWKESLNKRLFASQDLSYAQKAQEGVMAYLVRLWAPRMIQAVNNNQLSDYQSILDDVVRIMNNIRPANMPTPAVVCCLDGKTTSKASQALEEAFRMFDFSNSEARQEGLEIALSQISRCQSWEEFMASILKIELPAEK